MERGLFLADILALSTGSQRVVYGKKKKKSLNIKPSIPPGAVFVPGTVVVITTSIILFNNNNNNNITK